MTIKPVIKLENVSKYYKTPTGVSEGMRSINLDFYSNEFVAITGESGAGKTTLLNVLSGNDSYEDGELYINGKETSHFGVKEWERFRAANIGFVFQNYNIVESYTVYQNVAIALEAQNYPKDKIKERALALIKDVGLFSHRNQKATKLSGGEKQRVVIARALAKDAPIILADEPTGNLDEKTSIEILTLLKEISKNKLVVLVTHDLELARLVATRNVVMEDGGIKNDFQIENVEKKTAEFQTTEAKNKPLNKALIISIRNLFSTPKKTLFSLLLSMVAISAFLFLYSSIIKNTVTNFISSPNQLNEVIIIKRNEEDITLDEIDNLSKKNTTISYNHFAWKRFNISGLGLDPYVRYSTTLTKKDLIKGRLPKTKLEIVIYQNPIEYNAENVELDTTITFNNDDFTVVGITNKFLEQFNPVIYFHPSYFYNENLEVYDQVKDLFSEELSFDSAIARGIDRRQTVLFKNNIDTNKYQVIDSYMAIEHELNFIIGTILLFLWLVLIGILQIIFLVLFHVQKNMMEARKKDFGVYRSIGINEQEVGFVVITEQALIAIASTILTIIIFNILGLLFDNFANVVRNVRIYDYLIISLIFGMFTIYQGFKYNKRIFNTTVIEALREDF